MGLANTHVPDDALESFWRERLRGLAPLLEIPADHARPPRRVARVGVRGRRLSVRTLDGVRALARAEGVGTGDVMLAAFAALIARHAASRDIVVGVAAATPQPAAVIPLRLDCRDELSVRELARTVRVGLEEGRAHAAVPFERLVDLLGIERDPSYHPLVQIAFVWARAGDPGVQPGRSVAPIDLAPMASFDLTLAISEHDAGGVCAFQYDTALYDADTIERLRRRWLRLLAAAAGRPDRPLGVCDLLSPAERRRQLVEWNETATRWMGGASVQAAVAHIAARTPDAVAVTYEGAHLTYGALAAAARALAERLRQAGAGPDALVGVLLERSLDLVVAVVAILEAGAAYVPLDPAASAERLATLLRTADPVCVVTSGAFRGRMQEARVSSLLIDRLDQDAPEAAARAVRRPNEEGRAGGDRLCYVLFTSGTTGEPKGVAVTHAAVVNLLFDFRRCCEVTPADAVLCLAPLTFDIASLELLLPLVTGARLVMTPAYTLADGADLRARLAREDISVLQATPVTWRLLLNAGWQASAGMRLLCGSEPLPRELARELIATAGHVWNCYGPTETTIYSTFERLHSADLPITIGRAMANTSVYILDRHLQPVPIGVIGEIFIAGVGLARGYLGRPDLAAAAFIPDPFSARPGERMYASGDLGRYRRDGRIECHGRRDHQVKLHGRRIELAAIAHVLDTHPLVQASAAVVREDAARGRYIAAYVTSPAPDRLSRADLRGHVARQLPFYMIPSAIVVIDALPGTARAKLDRRALPPPTESDFHGEETTVAPRTASEAAVATLWCELLGLTTAGVDDNFFALGGNSLLVAELVQRVRDRLGAEISIRAFFEAPTIAGVAERIDRGRYVGAPAPATTAHVRRIPRDRPLPMSPLQEDWWRLEHFTGNLNPNNVHLAVQLAGRLSIPAVEQAFSTLTRRHEALRTVFIVGSDGLGTPRIHPSASRDRQLPLVDVSAMPAAVQRRLLDRIARREQHRVFDLTRLPLWRLIVIRLRPTEHLLVKTVQHLVCDAGSTELLMRELGIVQDALRRGAPARLPDLPFEFVDFVQWQRDWLTGPEAKAQVAYWTRQLARPADLWPPSAEDARYNGPFFSIRGRLPWVMGGDALAAAQGIARASGSTLFSVLTAALTLGLFAETGQPDVRIGTLTPNRELPGADDVMGVFLNAICLRTHVDGRVPFRTVVRGVHTTIGEGMAHQGVPFEVLSRALADDGPPSGLLYQVIFIWLGLPARPWAWPGIQLTADRRQPDRAAKVMTRNALPLRLELVETASDLRGTITYNPARFSADRIDAFATGVAQCLVIAGSEPAITVDAVCQRIAQPSCLPS